MADTSVPDLVVPDLPLSPDFQKPIDIEDIVLFNIFVRWSQQTVGFGELSMDKAENGKISMDTEGMGKEWTRRALHAVVDKFVDEAQW